MSVWENWGGEGSGVPLSSSFPCCGSCVMTYPRLAVVVSGSVSCSWSEVMVTVEPSCSRRPTLRLRVGGMRSPCSMVKWRVELRDESPFVTTKLRREEWKQLETDLIFSFNSVLQRLPMGEHVIQDIVLRLRQCPSKPVCVCVYVFCPLCSVPTQSASQPCS